MSNYTLQPYGEDAILINFKQVIEIETHHAVVQLYHQLKNAQLPEIISIIPAYCSIVVRYAHQITYSFICAKIEEIAQSKSFSTTQETKIIEVPVCYDINLGIDLQEVNKHTQLSLTEIINLHTSALYTVYLIGFTPGFPYLGGMDERLTTPRKNTPQLSVPKGAVGIANNQTGIYPNASPGGWQIIGQTPLAIFNPNQTPLFAIGDKVKFKAISLEEFNNHTS